VLCGVIERENRRSGEPVHDHVEALVSGRREPTTIAAYCTAARPLAIEAIDTQGRRTPTGYMNCPVWRAEQARLALRAQRIRADDVNFGNVGNRF